MNILAVSKEQYESNEWALVDIGTKDRLEWSRTTTESQADFDKKKSFELSTYHHTEVVLPGLASDWRCPL